jgi:hypothetical protein
LGCLHHTSGVRPRLDGCEGPSHEAGTGPR